MLNSKKVNKPKSKLSKLFRFIFCNILYMPIIAIALFIASYTYQSIYNNDINSTVTSNKVVVVESKKVPRIIPRRVLASRGGFDRDDRLIVSSSPVVTSTPTSEPTVIPTSTPTIKPVIVPTVKPTVKIKVKPTTKPKVKVKADNVGFKYIDSFRGTITKYTLAKSECGKSPNQKGFGITASGTRVKQGRTIATGSNIPFGSVIRIEGIDGTFIAEDTGNGVGKYGIDIYTTNRSTALKFGRQYRMVYIIKKGNGKITNNN